MPLPHSGRVLNAPPALSATRCTARRVRHVRARRPSLSRIPQKQASALSVADALAIFYLRPTRQHDGDAGPPAARRAMDLLIAATAHGARRYTRNLHALASLEMSSASRLSDVRDPGFRRDDRGGDGVTSLGVTSRRACSCFSASRDRDARVACW